MKTPGIHFRMLLTGIILIGTTTFAVGYAGVNIVHQFVQTRFDERIRFLADYLALNSELGILIRERSLLMRLAENLLSEKDITRVEILHENEQVLADVSKKLKDPVTIIEAPVYLKKNQEDIQTFQWQENGGTEDIIGKVRVSYSREGINSLLSYMKTRFIGIAIGFSILSVVIFYLISRSIAAPVSGLAKATRKVTRGNLKLRVTPGTLPETRELALAFNAMLDSIEESRIALENAHQEMVRQKTLAELGKFSLMIAHEVKNPLSIIKSSMDILKKQTGVASDNMMIIYIEDEIKRLNRLIEDFLLFARPAAPSFRPVPVFRLLKDNIDRMQSAAGDVTISESIPDTDLEIKADPDLLIRAINNILKNAIEASGHNGIVKIKSSCEDGNWIIEVDDSGEGISPENQPKLFEPFFTTRAKGTGLGLAFASQVIQAHQGCITAANKKGKGAVFRIEIPVKCDMK